MNQVLEEEQIVVAIPEWVSLYLGTQSMLSHIGHITQGDSVE